MTGRRESVWGWGWADKFPSDEARANIADQVQYLLGLDDEALDSQEPPSIEDVELREPRFELPTVFEGCCTRERRERARHTYGRSYPDVVRGFHADVEAPLDVVAIPDTDEQIAALLEWATEVNVAVVPFDGTSVGGGVEAG